MEGIFWMRGRRCLPKQEHKSLQREGRGSREGEGEKRGRGRGGKEKRGGTQMKEKGRCTALHHSLAGSN